MRRRPLAQVLAAAVQVDRDRRVVAVRDRPDDVLRAERRVAAEEHAGARRRHRRRVDDRHAVLVEREADIALDPRERVLLPDRDQHVVAREHARRARRSGTSWRRPLASFCGATFSNVDAGELAVVVRETPWARGSCGSGCPRASRPPFPTATPSSRRSRSARRPARRRRRAGARCGSSPSPCCRRPARRRACRSRRCARTTRDDSQSMPMWMLRRGFGAARHVEVAPARRAAADEDRVEAFAEQRLHAVDLVARPELDRPCRARSPSLRRSPRRAGGTSGICVRIMPPALRVAVEHHAARSPAARDRARR